MSRTEQLLNKLRERICHISDVLPTLDDNVTACLNHEALSALYDENYSCIIADRLRGVGYDDGVTNEDCGGCTESDLEFTGHDQLIATYDKMCNHLEVLSIEIRELHKHYEIVGDLKRSIASCSEQLKKLQTPSTGENEI